MMRRAKVTSAQVADRAGVSRTTVSLVLNHAPNVNISEATRQRVFQVARELGYVPDASAQALVQGYSRNLALVIFQPGHQMFFDPYLSQILSGITKVVRAHGFRLSIEVVDDADQIDRMVNLLRSGAVDGLITEHWMDTQRLLEAGLTPDDPFVILSETPLAEFCNICVDTVAGQRKLLHHLTERGHHNIACIPYTDPAKSPSLARRLRDFHAQLAAHDITIANRHVVQGDYAINTGYAAMQILLQQEPLPTAVYAMNDSMAFGAMRAIWEAGLRIPDDIAVVGHDDHRNAAWTIPALTTVRVPWLELGSAAATMLIQRVTGQPLTTRAVELHAELVVRESSG